MDQAQQAVSLFKQGFNCSQSILAAWAPKYGLPEESALKLAGGLGGGVGCMGKLCGALTGAVLVLGLRYGSADAKDKAGRYDLYRRTRDLMEQFKTQTGSMYCCDLLGFDMSTPEGQAASQQSGAFAECPQFVQVAAELLMKTLDSNETNT